MLLIVVYLFCTVFATATTGCKPAKINYYGFVARIYRYHLNSHMGWHPDFFSDHYKRYHWSHGTENRLKNNIKEQKPLKVVKKIKNINFDIHASSYEIVHGEVYGYPMTVSNFTLELSGYFRAHSTGTYTFRLAADNGATLQFGSGLTCCDDASGSVSGKFHIETMGPHGGGGNTAKNVHMASFDLTEGIYYPVKIVMFNWRGNAGLHLSATDPLGETTTEFGRAVFQGKFDQKCTTTVTSAWKKTFTSTKTQLGALTNTVVVRVPKATITRTIAGQHTYALTRTVTGELTNTVVVEKASSAPPAVKTSKKPLKKTTAPEKGHGKPSLALFGHPSPIEVSKTQSGPEKSAVVKPPAHTNKHKNHFESTFHGKNALHEKGGFLALTCIQSLLGKARRAADLPEYCLPEEEEMSAALLKDELFDPSILENHHDLDGLELNAKNLGFDNSTDIVSNMDEKNDPDFERLFGEYVRFEETLDGIPDQEGMERIQENERIDSTVAKTSLVSSFGNKELISSLLESGFKTTKESTATRAISTISGRFDGFDAGNLGENAKKDSISHHTMVPPNPKGEDEAALSLRRDQLFLALVRNQGATPTPIERENPRSENHAISSNSIFGLSAAGSTTQSEVVLGLPSMKSASVIHDMGLQPNEPELMSTHIVDDSALDSAAEPLPMSDASPSQGFLDQKPEESLMGNAVVSSGPEFEKVSFYSNDELSTSSIRSQSEVWIESNAEPQPSVVSNLEFQEHSRNVESFQNIVSGYESAIQAMSSSYSSASVSAREPQLDVAKGHIAPEKAGQVSQSYDFEKERIFSESLSLLPDLPLSNNIHEIYTWGSESTEPAASSDVEPIQALLAAFMQNLKLVDTSLESVITPLEEGLIHNTGFGVSLADESHLSGLGGKMAPELLFAEETAGVSNEDHLPKSELSNGTFEAAKLLAAESVSTNHSSTPSPGLLSANILQPKETGTVGEEADMVPGNEEMFEEDLGEVFGNGEEVFPEESYDIGQNVGQNVDFESTSLASPSIPFPLKDSSETMSGSEASFSEKYQAADSGFEGNSLVLGSGNEISGFTPVASLTMIESLGSSEVLEKISFHSPESEELPRLEETLDVASASPVELAGQESGSSLSEHKKAEIHEVEMHKSEKASAVSSLHSNANTFYDEIDLVSGAISALSGAGVVSESLSASDLAQSTVFPLAASDAFPESKSDKIALPLFISPGKTAEMHLSYPAKDLLAQGSYLDKSGSPRDSFEKAYGQATDDANVTEAPNNLSGSDDFKESLFTPGSSLTNKNSVLELASNESDTIVSGFAKENIMGSTPSSVSFDESSNDSDGQVTDKDEEKNNVSDESVANDTSRDSIKSISALGKASMSMTLSDLGSDSGSVSDAESANLRAKDGFESNSEIGLSLVQTHVEFSSALLIRNGSKSEASETVKDTNGRASSKSSHSKYSEDSAGSFAGGTESEFANLELLNISSSTHRIGSHRLPNLSGENVDDFKALQSENADSEYSMGDHEFEDISEASDEDNSQNLFGVDVFTSLQGSLDAYKAAETGAHVNKFMKLPSKSALENEIFDSEPFELRASKVFSQAAPLITSGALEMIDENQSQVDAGESISQAQVEALGGLNLSSAKIPKPFAILEHENGTDTLFHHMAWSGEYSFSGSQPAKSSGLSLVSDQDQISASHVLPESKASIDFTGFADASLGSVILSNSMAEVYQISQMGASSHGHENSQHPLPSSHGEFAAEDSKTMPPAEILSQDFGNPAFPSGVSMVNGVSQTDRDEKETPASSHINDVIPSSHASFPEGSNQVFEVSKHPDFDSYSLLLTEDSREKSYFVDSEKLVSKFEEKAYPKSSETPVEEEPSQTVGMELSPTDLADSEFDDLHGNGQGIEISTDAFETSVSTQEEMLASTKSDFGRPTHSSKDSTSASLDEVKSSQLPEFSAKFPSLDSKTPVPEDDSKSDPSMATGEVLPSSIMDSDSSSHESFKEPRPLRLRKSVAGEENVDSTGPGPTIVPANNTSIADTIISLSVDAAVSSASIWTELGKGQGIIDEVSHSAHQRYSIHEKPSKNALESHSSGIYAESVPSPSTQGAAETESAWSRIGASSSLGIPSFDVYDLMRMDEPSENGQNEVDESVLVSLITPIGASSAKSEYSMKELESLTISEIGSAASEVAPIASSNVSYSAWAPPVENANYAQEMADIREENAKLVGKASGDGFGGTSEYGWSQIERPKEKIGIVFETYLSASANEKDLFASAAISGNATFSIASESMMSSALNSSSSTRDFTGHSHSLLASPAFSTSHSAGNSSESDHYFLSNGFFDSVNSKDYDTFTNHTDSATGALGNSFTANLKKVPQSGRHDAVNSTDLNETLYLRDHAKGSGHDSALNILAQGDNLVDKEHAYMLLLEDMMFADEAVHANDDMSTDQVGQNAFSTEVPNLRKSGIGKPGKEKLTTSHVISAASFATMTSLGSHLPESSNISTQQSLGDEPPLDLQETEMDEDIRIDGFAITDFETMSESAGTSLLMNESSGTMATRTSDVMELSGNSARNTSLTLESSSNSVTLTFSSDSTDAQTLSGNLTLLQSKTSALETGSTHPVFPSFSAHMFDLGQISDSAALRKTQAKTLSRESSHGVPTGPMVTQAMVETRPTAEDNVRYTLLLTADGGIVSADSLGATFADYRSPTEFLARVFNTGSASRFESQSFQVSTSLREPRDQKINFEHIETLTTIESSGMAFGFQETPLRGEGETWVHNSGSDASEPAILSWKGVGNNAENTTPTYQFDASNTPKASPLIYGLIKLEQIHANNVPTITEPGLLSPGEGNNNMPKISVSVKNEENENFSLSACESLGSIDSCKLLLDVSNAHNTISDDWKKTITTIFCPYESCGKDTFVADKMNSSASNASKNSKNEFVSAVHDTINSAFHKTNTFQNASVESLRQVPVMEGAGAVTPAMLLLAITAHFVNFLLF
ncbi:PA14 domain-containing protein [Metschnikowia aff. pulcherrima]|uniref:PA14 domain-containing protein n=1 Tax=Metschnikowia aff. pulcherrima TaxID=2163413 RepID=A0A4P6XS18_9ASCO|nr:PA14 domain-containing protein [Metschnikowia aff. pulcherrima]